MRPAPPSVRHGTRHVRAGRAAHEAGARAEKASALLRRLTAEDRDHRDGEGEDD
ncbi:hypothetical protein SALBM135S_10141 [Streptomyces alboniger]